jgi:hypothetical protein
MVALPAPAGSRELQLHDSESLNAKTIAGEESSPEQVPAASPA